MRPSVGAKRFGFGRSVPTATVRPGPNRSGASLVGMAGDTDIAALGSVLSDERRTRILLALGDGRALSASVLAGEAGVAASTASEHLAKLVDGGLLVVEPHGRHRYYRIAGPEVGE